MNWLGIDIGGANLKVADGLEHATTLPFTLWSKSDKLSRALRRMIAEAPPADRLAITMTGELADCFETRTDGVLFILNAVEEAADGRHIRVYLNNGRQVAPQAARRTPLLAAAANWHALARFVCRYTEGEPALLIDVGSTTIDLIPLEDNEPRNQGTTDTERLLSGELVYTGIERSPICAVVDELPYRGRMCPVARELFATTRDAYILIGDLREHPTETETADGRPATKGASRARMARMICATEDEFNHRDAVFMAEAVAESHSRLVAEKIAQVIQQLRKPPARIILSGHGEFLARNALKHVCADTPTVSLTSLLGIKTSRAASAHALAVLSREAVAP